MLKHLADKLAIHHKHQDGKKFAWMNFFFCCGLGSFGTIFPLVLFDLFGEDGSKVGLYYAIIAFLMLVWSMATTPIFQKYRKKTILVTALTTAIILLCLMTLASEIWTLAIFDIPRAFCIMTVRTTLSLLVFENVQHSKLAEEEGRFFLFNNLGWIVGPTTAGYFASFFGNDKIFILVSFYFLIMLVYFFKQKIYDLPIQAKKIRKFHLSGFFRNSKDYFSNAEFRKCYLTGLGLYMWWAVALTYIPIIISEFGYGQEIVGIIMTLAVVPLATLEVTVGKLAQQNGIKKYIMLGFGYMMCFPLFLSIFHDKAILVACAFILINVGSAFIEPLQETLFFKTAGHKNSDRMLGVHNTMFNLSNIVGPLLGSIILSLGLGYSTIWLIMAVFLFLAFLNTFTLNKKFR